MAHHVSWGKKERGGCPTAASSLLFLYIHLPNLHFFTLCFAKKCIFAVYYTS